MGVHRNTPDEFRVVTHAPLTLPPDYSLRPPRPGDPRPQELAPDQEARQALFGQDVGQDSSTGERALVANAGASAASTSVRDQVDFEGANVVHRDQAFADRVVQSQGATQDAATPPAGTTEEQRTAQQEAIRRATGGGTVTIERRRGEKLPGT